MSEQTIATAPTAPFYSIAYVMDKNGPIEVVDRYNNTANLRKATPADIANSQTGDLPVVFFVRIQHEIKYPYTGIEYTEIIDHDSPTELWPRDPDRFCQAFVGFIPKMELI